ncbi:MAG TPA: hypothetical protein VK190_04770 [Pseudoneobacillus sp.]|nr:hypothetical protein [Pseudoneobacillus sp.]
MLGETVTISKKEYESLLQDSRKLNRLEAYGVDNWVGYGDAMSDSMQLFCEEEDEE